MPELAYAKRGPKPKVAPIVYKSVRYSAEGTGSRAYVKASDPKTNKLLWEATIFRRLVSPIFGETDVQNVFIKSMFIDGDKLIAISEDKEAYSLDLKTRKVQKLKQIPSPPQQAPRPN
jgi:hypothetical protein